MTTTDGAAWPGKPANDSTVIQMGREVCSELLTTMHLYGELEISWMSPCLVGSLRGLAQMQGEERAHVFAAFSGQAGTFA